MPCQVNYYAFCVEGVLELDDNGVASLGSNGGTGKLAIDTDHHILKAIGLPKKVTHFPFVTPNSGSPRQREQGPEEQNEKKRSAGHDRRAQ